MSLRSIRGLCVALIVVASGTTSVEAAGTSGLVQKQAGFAASLSTQQKAGLGYSKLDRTLINVAEAAKTVPKTSMVEGLKAAAPNARLSITVPAAVPTVLTDITVKGDTAQVEAQLRQLGVTKLSTYSNLISAWIPANHLTDAAAIGTIRSMRAPQAKTHTGSVESQGDFVQRSTFLRASTQLPGLTGAGLTVGVLSDSFGCTTSPTSYADDVASGDLPANLEVLEELDGCTGGADEGRAISQIVYDVAPGVTLKFNTAFNGEADFANGIIALANAGANVIVDDVSYFDEPFYQDGILSQAVDQVRAMGVAYYSSAGNSARNSYEAPFANSGVVGPAGGQIAGEQLMNFDTSGATQTAILPITIPANASVLIYFEWDDPYATGGGPNGGAKSLLDMCLVDSTTGGVGDDNIEFCAGPVSAGQDPFNGLQFSNPNNSDVSAGLTIGVAAGSPLPGRIKMVYSGISVDQFATNSGTVQGHPAAVGATAVGASYFRGNPVCLPAIYPEYALESYSSSGGTPILFDESGNRLATPVVRQKPEIVAPDGVLTTFFDEQLGARSSAVPQCTNPANGYNFFGTSAAAPHAAGVAALLLQAQPLANPDDLKSAIETSALTSIGTILSGSGTSTDPYVYDNLSTPNFNVGYGFVQADAALPNVLPIATLALPAIDFGGQLVSSTLTKNLTLTNTGGFRLTISSVVSSGGDFSATYGTCPQPPATLAPAASCTLAVSYRPSAPGASAPQTLTITSNSSDGTVKTLALTGTGTVPGDTGGSFGLLSLVFMAGAALRRRLRLVVRG